MKQTIQKKEENNMNTNNELECRIEKVPNYRAGDFYYVYFGSEMFCVQTRTTVYQHALMRVDNALEKANGNMDKFNSLMITRLGKMTKIDKIINTIVVLHVKGLHDCLKNHTARLLLEVIRNGSLRANN